MKKFIATVKFEADRNGGGTYELKSAKLTINAKNQAIAKKIAERWMDNCWKFYSMSVRERP